MKFHLTLVSEENSGQSNFGNFRTTSLQLSEPHQCFNTASFRLSGFMKSLALRCAANTQLPYVSKNVSDTKKMTSSLWRKFETLFQKPVNAHKFQPLQS